MITFYFLVFAGLTTGWPNLARIQFVPALLAGSFGIVLILLVAMIHYSHLLMELLSSKERAEIKSRFLFILLLLTNNFSLFELQVFGFGAFLPYIIRVIK